MIASTARAVEIPSCSRAAELTENTRKSPSTPSLWPERVCPTDNDRGKLSSRSVRIERMSQLLGRMVGTMLDHLPTRVGHLSRLSDAVCRVSRVARDPGGRQARAGDAGGHRGRPARHVLAARVPL